jgi:predicted DNA-binding transcriptional regulator AlpA
MPATDTVTRYALRKQEIASRIGTCTKTWDRMVTAGKAPQPDIACGRIRRWSCELIEEWIRSQRVGA